MAEGPPVAVAAGRSRSWLRLGLVDLADGSKSDADLRPAPARTRVLRRDHPRQSGLGPAWPGAVDLRPGRDQEDPRGVPHARDSGWRPSEPAHRLQELRSEAVFQGRPGMPDRGNVSQPERLWREQGSVKSAVPAKDRPGNQPALTGSRTC